MNSSDIDLFNRHHTFSIHSLEENDNEEYPPAFLYPPHFAFLRPSVRSRDYYEIPWAYYFWHELFHAENLHLTNIGVMENILESLSENLALYGLYQFVINNDKEGDLCLRKSIDMAKKQDLFIKETLVVNEIPSTYFQVSEYTRELMTDLIYDNILTTFFSGKIKKSSLNNYVEFVGNLFVTEVENEESKRKIKINWEHEAAFRYGEEIRKSFGDVDLVHTIPLYSMEIDISKIDFVEMNYWELATMLKKDDENLNSQYRLEKTLKEGNNYLAKMIETAEENGDCCEEHVINCILSSSDLPDEIIKIYESRKGIDPQKEKEVKSLSVKEIFKRQKVFIEDTDLGTLFFIVPEFIEGDKQEYYQNILSNSYAYELILRSFGSSKYSNEWMRLVKQVLNDLDEKVSEPSRNHKFAEKCFKVSF